MLRDLKFISDRTPRHMQWGTTICVAAVTLVAIGIRPPGGESMPATLSAQEKSATPAKSGGAANVVSWWTNNPLDAVLDAWEQKAPSMTSVECSWHETRVFMPGSAISPAMIDHLELAEQLPDIDRNVGWPNEVTKVSRQRTLRLMGKWRYLQDFSIGPSIEGLSAIVTDRISSNVGKVSLQHSSDRGRLGEECSWSDAQSVTFIPVRYLLRPANRGFVSAARQEFVVKASDSATGLITLADNQGLELIVDASKGFVVTHGKRVSQKTGNTNFEFEVSFEHTDGKNWRPTGWNMFVWDFLSNAESPKMRFVATEFTWELNKTLELKDLTIQLPQGISIYDSEGKLVTSIEP